MEIIIPPKRFTAGDRWKAIERELRSGVELKKATEEARATQAAQQAQDMKRTVKGLGKCVAVIPEWEYFRMKQKYGGEVKTKEFLKYFQRKFSHLAPNKV